MFHQWRLRLSMARNLELLASARRFGSFFLFLFSYSQSAIRSVAFHFRVFCLIFAIIFIVFELNICESDPCLLICFFLFVCSYSIELSFLSKFSWAFVAVVTSAFFLSFFGFFSGEGVQAT